MPKDHRPYSASYLILQRENDDKILLMKRKNTGFADGKYSAVAGHVDEGENFKTAMIREAEEEIGINIEREDLKTTTVIHRKSGEKTYVDIFFKATDWQGKPENMEPEKCSELKWFNKEELPENTLTYVKQVIENLSNAMTYKEIGWK